MSIADRVLQQVHEIDRSRAWADHLRGLEYVRSRDGVWHLFAVVHNTKVRLSRGLTKAEAAYNAFVRYSVGETEKEVHREDASR